MRSACLAALLALVAAPVAAQLPGAPPAGAAPPPSPGLNLFVSPMGEPYRGDESPESLAAQWFLKADADHDGRLTLKEMQADAARFFQALDTDHDGEIAPEEIEHYENQLVPEIRMGFNRGMGYRVHTKFDGESWSPEVDENATAIVAPREGAGRYGYIDMREPVTSADTNLNRGVSLEEFTAAAAKRFSVLDAEHRGYLTSDTLPELPKAKRDKRREDGRKRGRR